MREAEEEKMLRLALEEKNAVIDGSIATARVTSRTRKARVERKRGRRINTEAMGTTVRLSAGQEQQERRRAGKSSPRWV